MRAFTLFCILGWMISLNGASRLSPLSPEPDWERLSGNQFTITRERFEWLLDQIYSADRGLRTYLKISDESVTVFSDQSKKNALFSLFFSKDIDSLRENPRKTHFGEKITNEKPLQGLKVCLDPGHIGGEYSKLEGRFFQMNGDPSVEEAKLNLITSRLIEARLQNEGVEVVWTKGDEMPATEQRPDRLREAALHWIYDLGVSQHLPCEEEISSRANMLFYRTSEIRTRAERVRSFKPDLTLCIHYNAGDWGPDPRAPKWVEKSRLVLFITGGFMASELKYDDQKYDLFAQLLEQSEDVELGVSSKIALRMKESFKMPPEQYQNWGAVVAIKDEPYLYARNLAANRWFEGPTVFVEGPYMNARDAYDRIIAGDYEGEREIRGERLPSIYRQYADAVVEGVIDYYRAKKSKAFEVKKQVPAVWNP